MRKPGNSSRLFSTSFWMSRTEAAMQEDLSKRALQEDLYSSNILTFIPLGKADRKTTYL